MENRNIVIKKTASFVKHRLKDQGSSHDWWHAYRVWKISQRLAKAEKNVDTSIVELGALLHDIADWKFHGGDTSVGAKIARQWLKSQKVDTIIIDQVCHIVEEISFKGIGVKSKLKTKEGKIVQDADRLDAIGAIGIARAFSYGGQAKREMHNPATKSRDYKTFAQYKNNTAPTINHFYEKLLLVKDLMNTKTAKKIAASRHKYMLDYLKRFYNEWDGKI